MHHTLGTINTILNILIRNNHIDGINSILKEFDTDDLWNNFDVPIELLKVTLPVKHKLTERTILYDRLMDKVIYERGKENAIELLKGLQ